MATDRRVTFLIGANIKNFQKGLNTAQKRFRKFGREMQSIGSTMSQTVTLPLLAIGTIAVKSAAELDALKQGFTAITGSAKEANEQIKRLREIAKLPAVDFMQAAKTSMAFQAIGKSAEFAERTIKGVANAVALSGGGAQEFSGVMRQLRQVASLGRLMGEEMNTILENAPAMAKAIETAFGTTSTEKIRKLGLTSEQFFDRLNDALESLPHVTGGAKNSLDNLRQALTNAAQVIGDHLLPVVIPIVEKITAWLEGLRKLNPEVVRTGIIVAGLAAAIGPVIWAMGTMVTSIAAIMGGLKKLMGGLSVLLKIIVKFPAALRLMKMRVTALGRAMVALKATMLANPYLAVGAAIAAIGVAVWRAYEGIKAFRAEVEAFNKSIEKVLSSGTKSWEKVNEKIAEVAEKMAAIEKTMRGYNMAPEANENWQRLNKQLSDLIELRDELATKELKVKIGMKNLKATQKLMEFLNTDFTNLATFAKDNANVIAVPFVKAKKVIDKIIPALDTIKNGFKGFQELTAKEITTNPGDMNFNIQGGSMTALNNGLDVMQKKLRNLTIGSPAFKKLRKEIWNTEKAIYKSTTGMSGALGDFFFTAKKAGVDLANFLAGQVTNAIVSFSENLGRMFAGAGNEFATGLQKVLLVVADFAKTLGGLLVSIGTALELIPGFGQVAGTPYIIAGAALIVAASAGSAFLNKNIEERKQRAQENNIPGMAMGGIVPAGFPNDTYPAMLSSGETVIPSPKPLPSMGGGRVQIIENVVNLDGKTIYRNQKRVENGYNR